MKIVTLRVIPRWGKNSRRAFTLIEIMVAIAIITILAATVLVSMKSFGAKARSAKAQARLSSVIPNMISCWGNGGEVRKPTTSGNGTLCYINGALNSNFGTWPARSGDLSTYYFLNLPSSATINCPNSGAGDICLDRGSWYIYWSSSSSYDGQRVCCNSRMNGCKVQAWSGTGFESCTASSPTN